MITIITNTIKAKYYTYVPGEFFPVYSGSELINKKEFHIYKAKRAVFLIKNYKAVVHAYTHQRG